MSSSLADRLDGMHPRMSKMTTGAGESELRKTKIADPLTHGRVVYRAFQIANIEPKWAAGQMGYSEATVVYRWFAGKEQANLDKLLALGPAWRRAYFLALAEACEADVVVKTTIEIARPA